MPVSHRSAVLALRGMAVRIRVEAPARSETEQDSSLFIVQREGRAADSI